jgi:magnesium-transporting ATPase (P-type)
VRGLTLALRDPTAELVSLRGAARDSSTRTAAVQCIRASLSRVTHGLQDLAPAFEPGEPGVLERPPRPRREGVMSRLLWERTAVSGLVMASGTLALFQWERSEGASLMRAQTTALTIMVVFQVFHVGNGRSDHRSVFNRSPFSNPFLFIATAAAVLMHIGAMHFGLTQIMLRVEPLEPDAWLRMVAVAATIIVAIELHKLVRRDDRAFTRR